MESYTTAVGDPVTHQKVVSLSPNGQERSREPKVQPALSLSRAEPEGRIGSSDYDCDATGLIFYSQVFASIGRR